MSITSAIVTIIGAWGGGSALFWLFKSMLDDDMPTLGGSIMDSPLVGF